MTGVMIDDSLVFTAKEMLLFKHSSMTLGEFVLYVQSVRTQADPLLTITIFHICCRTTGVDLVKAMSRNRDIEAVFARQMAMFFVKTLRNKMSLTAIGKEIGGRTHATVLHSIKVVEDLIDPAYPGDFRRKWFTKALARIEHRLGRTVYINQ